MTKEGKVRKKVVIEYPAGTELSKSRKSKDGFSPLVRSTDKSKRGVQTQVEIFIPDEDEEAGAIHSPNHRVRRAAEGGWEPTPAQRDMMISVVGVGVDRLLDRLEQAAREWVTTRPARKAERRQRQEMSAKRAAADAPSRHVTEGVEPSGPPQAEMSKSSNETNTDIDVPTISMALADWKNALHALLLTRTMSSELWQVLAHARIVGADATTLEQQREMAQLTPDEFEGRVAEMLTANPSMVDQPLSRLLAELVEAPSGDGPSVPGADEAKAPLP